MLRTLIRVSVGVTLLVAVGVTDGVAEPWIVQTGCSSVVIDGVTYPQVWFAVHNVDPNHAADYVAALPAVSSNPEQDCHAIAAEGPDTWAALAEPNDGTALWAADNQVSSNGLAPGDSLGGFRLVVRPGSSCCFGFSFSGPFEPFASEQVCFECSLPVPVRRATWGAVKLIYR